MTGNYRVSPGTAAEFALAVLEDGPATAPEIATEDGCTHSAKAIGMALRRLADAGVVCADGTLGGCMGRPAVIFRLADV